MKLANDAESRRGWALLSTIIGFWAVAIWLAVTAHLGFWSDMMAVCYIFAGFAAIFALAMTGQLLKRRSLSISREGITISDSSASEACGDAAEPENGGNQEK